MAIRGGYGVFFEHTNGNEGNTESLEGFPPSASSPQRSSTSSGYGNIGGGRTALSVVRQFHSQQGHLALYAAVEPERSEGTPIHIVLSVAYVGSKGTHLTLVNDANQLLPVPAKQSLRGGNADCPAARIAQTLPPTPPVSPLPPRWVTAPPCQPAALPNLWVACGNSADALRTAFPGFSNITQLNNQANSIYHALQVAAQRTVGDLTLSLAYTYSHSIDDSSDRCDTAFVNAYNIAANRASSTFDMRHNLSISYVYGLPFFKAIGPDAHSAWRVAGFRHHCCPGWASL